MFKKLISLSLAFLLILVPMSSYAQKEDTMAYMTISKTRTSITLGLAGLEHPSGNYDQFAFGLSGNTINSFTPSATFSGLSCGSDYTGSAAAKYNGVWYTVDSGRSIKTDLCSAPSISASSITDNSMTISWTSVSGAAGYVLIFDGSVYDRITTSWSMTGLSPSTNYSFSVWAVDGSGDPKSETRSGSATTNAGLPGLSTPTGLSATNITNTSFIGDWNSVPNASSYDVQLRRETDQVTWNYTTASTGYFFSGLSPGTSYSYRVRASASGYITSSYSFWVGATTSAFSPWSWSYNITSGGNVYNTTTSGGVITAYVMPATEWNNFTSLINQVRVSKGLNNYSFTAVGSNTNLTLAILEQARLAISGMGISIPTFNVNPSVPAEYFNRLKDALNDAING